MDETIKQVVIGAVIISFIAVVIAAGLTYWYVLVALGAVGFGIYFLRSKHRDKRNRV